MTTHELANILLKQEDVPVEFHFYHDEANCYCSTPINVAELYEGIMYLAETEFVSLEEEERRYQEECRRVREERRKREEAEARLPKLKNILNFVSEEARDAFILYLDNCRSREAILDNLHDDADYLTRIILNYYGWNARLSKEHVIEILVACLQFGIKIPIAAIAAVKHHDISTFQREMFKSETDKRIFQEARQNQMTINDMKQFNLGDVISFPSVEEMELVHVRTEIEKRKDSEIVKEIYKINCCVDGKPDTIEVIGREVNNI